MNPIFYIYCSQKPGEIEETITTQQIKALAKKQTVQPYVLIQGGTLDDIQSIFIVVDKLRYSFTSFLFLVNKHF